MANRGRDTGFARLLTKCTGYHGEGARARVAQVNSVCIYSDTPVT
jgi:hypothetical protein